VKYLRAGRLCAAMVICFLVLASAGAVHAADQVLIGVNAVRFAWPAASGTPSGYIVSRSVNGGGFQWYASTTEPAIEIPVASGDQISIRVAATGYDSAGAFHISPYSTVSDRVSVWPSPLFPVTGSWLLRCATCNQLATRSLGNASLVLAQATGLAAPWRVIGMAQLQYGRDEIIWYNTSTGKFAVYDGQFLAPVTGLSAFGPLTLRGVGAADLDGDGVEEFITQRNDTGGVMVWGINSKLLENIGTIPGPAGAPLLAAARDFDRDGKVDLLWHDPDTGTLDLWKMAKDPTLALPISTLRTSVVRVASGLASDATVAATGDYDGDGNVDVLWRYGDGRLGITYLNAGVPLRYVALGAVAGDGDRRVIGSIDIGGTVGEEIALQDNLTGLISILDPSPSGTNTRTLVLHPGNEWRVVAVGS
jgi:hypothetical protein